MTEPFKTLDEILGDPEISNELVERIIKELRERGEWGSRGLYKKIADKTGYTAAYVGRVLSGKQRITKAFLLALANELDIRVLNANAILEAGDAYDVWGKILFSYEVLLTAAIERYGEIAENSLLLQQTRETAYNIFNMQKDMADRFDQKKLHEIKKLAAQLLNMTGKE